ncbi:uncharacterized protein [Diadema setosum]|uniref:uncharacterized protein isoform X2 n=1 Tax=Diadema setosum TaxID=31175 RepID=UPI003B3A4849
MTAYECHCPPVYTGIHCDEDINECMCNPCQHDGLCINQVGSFVCNCQNGTTGTLCEIDIDECTSYPCQYDGLCIDQLGFFECSCQNGTTGTLCEIDVNECMCNPCQHDGVCINQVGSFVCNCQNGTTGTLCEIDVDECMSNPCQHGGQCIDQLGLFVCNCQNGTTGTLCEIDINECTSNPCQHDGTCVDQLGSFVCMCLPGTTGTLCEIDINECTSNPCQHGGSCIDRLGSFGCTCLPGTSGTLCEIDVNECERNPCLNGGTCVDLMNNYTCSCPSYLDGSQCEILRNFSIRLVHNSDNWVRGRLEVLWNSTWTSLRINTYYTHNLFDNNATAVACRQLGFTGHSSFQQLHHTSTESVVFVFYLVCSGQETDLGQCQHYSIFLSRNHYFSIVVQEITCAETQVRLTDGSTSDLGRVEIFYQGTWGTVCGNLWDDEEAGVVCRMLGYSSGETIPALSVSTKPMVLSDVQCVGSETDIGACEHSPFMTGTCNNQPSTSQGQEAWASCYTLSN